MTYAELKQELQDRGFDYLSSARQGQFINRSYLEIAEEEDWPWLEATTSGTAPISITDVRTVESVHNTTQGLRLRPVDRRHILDTDDDLASTGSPYSYYLTSGNSLAVYPANTADTISVRYWKAPTPLSADADLPLVPTRFHLLIVDGAAAYAYFDSDNFEAAREMLSLWNEGKARMRDALLSSQHDSPDDFISSRVDHQDATH